MSANQMNSMPPGAQNNNVAQQMAGNKRSREFAYQEPAGQQQQQQQQQAGAVPNYMGYFPPGVPMPQSMYQQMPSNSDVPVMALPPLYVGPPMTMTVHGNQVGTIEQNGNSEGTPSKKKHTSQWALEKRRARNRVTAAESRRKSKLEAQTLRDEVARLSKEIKEKNELLGEFKEKYQLYENGQPKEEIDRIVTQRRAAMAAASAAASAASDASIASTIAPSAQPIVAVPPKAPIGIDATGETARL